MLKYSCPHCGAVYFGPGHRPKETDRCGYCQNPIRAIYLTDEEYGAEVNRFGEDLEEHQSWRAHAADLDAREYRGGLSRWGVEA